MGEPGGRCERKDKQRNLERVLRAAHELIAEHGAGVTMEEVARRAGVGVGTIYRRFPSKEQLLAAVSGAACQDARHCVAQAADDAASPLEKLRAIVMAQYRQNSQQASLLDMGLGAEGEVGGCAIPAQQADLYSTLRTLLRVVLTEGQRANEIRAGDPDLLAALCLELLSPRVYQRLQPLVAGPPEEVANHVISFVLSGVQQR
jgi:AcrR family transcriptional regulator